MNRIPEGFRTSTGSSITMWKRVMDIQLRLKNARLDEEEMDHLHAELQEALAQLRVSYADKMLKGTRFLRPGMRAASPPGHESAL
ncbi:MAG: hypothetical protein ABJF88_16245 [Rhodothermales bacterium]